MKNRRNDEWMEAFAYKIALSAPCVCMGTLAALVWAVILKLLNSMVFKVIVSIPAVILLVSIAILLYEIWRGDFEDND
jgi:hypothetical protein|nr:MAG TPA: hypothetical protein [Caudoviricetes sp.]